MRIHVLLAVLFVSCGSPEPTQPKVVRFQPSTIVEGDATTLTIELEGEPPFIVDYGRDAVEFEGDVRVKFGTLALTASRLPGSPNQVSVGVPPTLQPGDYALEVELPDGREAGAALPLTVAPSPMPVRYTIAPIGEQKRGEPFTLIIRAEGGSAATFTGTVELEAKPGNITPRRTGNFTAGVKVETVQVTAIDDAMVITLRDDAGRTASSNPFRVAK